MVTSSASADTTPLATPATSTAPPATSAPSVYPVNLTACCDAVVTFPQSPAFQFYPTAYSPARASVTLSNGSAFAPAWPDLTYAYDRSLLSLARGSPPVFSVLNTRYTGTLVTAIFVVYARSGRAVNASVALTIVDVRNITLYAAFPDTSPPGAPLYRVHCSDAFQSVAFTASAYIETIGSMPIPAKALLLSLTNPAVAAVRGASVTGVAQGATDVLASWWGYTDVYANLTVSNASVVFVGAYSPPYTFTGEAGQILPLALTLSLLVPGAQAASDPGPYPLPAPGLVALSVPPSARLTLANDALYSVSNSLGPEFVSFTVTPCEGLAPAYQAPLLVNLAPGPYDMDLGAEGPVLALQQDPESGAPARLPLRQHLPRHVQRPREQLHFAQRTHLALQRGERALQVPDLHVRVNQILVRLVQQLRVP